MDIPFITPSLIPGKIHTVYIAVLPPVPYGTGASWFLWSTIQERCMEIYLNGAVCDTSASHLMGLVKEQGLEPRAVIVEHNHGIIKQADWEQTVIQKGDTVELLSFVGGG